MKHHFKRAMHVYRKRGFGELVKSAFTYTPIEVNNFLFLLGNRSGTKVMTEDWDTLIILDACRYDMFDEMIPFDGQLESRISLGSTSEEFLERNFSNGAFHDTVYVNANVYFAKLGLDQDRTFHAVIDLLDEWDQDLEIAHPKTVTKAAIRAHNKYPNKRVVVHYMQPHIPFIGERGLELHDQIGYRNAWEPFREGKRPVSISELWDGYKENLDFAFDYVRELLGEINGKVVISSDHGNMVGERQGPIPTKKMFGHPWGVYTKELIQVPWFEMRSGKRRTIRTDPPVTGTKHSDELINNRLQALGYRE